MGGGTLKGRGVKVGGGSPLVSPYSSLESPSLFFPARGDAHNTDDTAVVGARPTWG